MEPIVEGIVAASAEANASENPIKASEAETNFTPKFRSFFDNAALLKGISLAAYEVDKSKKLAVEKVETSRVQGEPVVSDRMLCSMCGGIAFENRKEQTEHYKSDWHRFNLKQRIKGCAPVTIETFEEAAAGDISSISGSNTESDDDSDEAPKLTLPARQAANAGSGGDEEEEEEESYHIEGIGRRHPRVFFRNEDDELVSVYRCVIHGKKNAPESGEELVTMATNLPKEMLWVVILMAGGHFAAGVFRGGEVVARKTFHRYVVRAKRGTVQSVRDSQGGAPKSAGANIRREQEKQLGLDIKTLLESWSEHMASCHRIFLRASGSGRQVFFAGKTPLLAKSDARIRMVPFPTRRPTHRELLRVQGQLAGVEVHGKELGITDFIAVAPRKTRNQAQNSPRRSPRQQRTKVRQPDAKATGDKSSSEDDAAVDLGYQDEVSDLTSLKQFEATKRPKKKKKKKEEVQEPKQQHQLSPASEPIDEELYHVRNSLYTACKVGDLSQLQSLLASLQSSKNLQSSISQSETSIHDRQSEIETQDTTDNTNQSVASIKSATIQTDQSEASIHDRQSETETQDTTDNTNQSDASIETAKIQTDQSEASEKDLGQSDGRIENVQLCANSGTPNSSNETDSSKWDVVKVLNMPFGDNSTTLLHVAAKENQKQLVNALLGAGADPTVKERNGATPYIATSNKDTRNEFRRFMAQFPDKYDYARAQIPGPLTDDMEAEKKKKEAEKKKQQKKAKKERQKEQKAIEAVARAEEEEKRRYVALSDREKRALAAEKRLATQYKDHGQAVPVISRCFQCAGDMTGKVPFEYSDNKFCSPACLKLHRTKKT